MSKTLLLPLIVLALLFAGGAPSLAKGGKGKPPPEPDPTADPAIAYVAHQRKNQGLWVMNADGSNKTHIYEGSVRGPSFSPDGSEIAFFTYDGQDSRLRIIGVDGGGLRTVHTKTGAFIGGGTTWSATGWIAFTDDESATSAANDVYVVRPDGTGLTNLTETLDREEFWPSWNGAGDKLAVIAFELPFGPGDHRPVIVYSVGLVDGVPAIVGETNVTDVPGGPLVGGDNWESPHLASFARNTDRLVVQAIVPGETLRSLWILDLAAPADTWRLSAPDTDNVLPRWCEDDERVIFLSAYRNSSVLWSVDATTGGDLERLGNKDQHDPACRP